MFRMKSILVRCKQICSCQSSQANHITFQAIIAYKVKWTHSKINEGKKNINIHKIIVLICYKWTSHHVAIECGAKNATATNNRKIKFYAHFHGAYVQSHCIVTHRIKCTRSIFNSCRRKNAMNLCSMLTRQNDCFSNQSHN